MHGLMNRAVESFVKNTYGIDAWSEVTSTAALGFETFELMLSYDPTITESVINAAAFELERSRNDLLEDIGHYLVTNPNSEAIRRLLRFGGATFEDFLESLEDLPDRSRLALPDKTFPPLTLHQVGRGDYILLIHAELEGIAHFVIGALRGMADDYGVLALIEARGRFQGAERLTIVIHDDGFSSGRDFKLVAGAAL